MFYNSSIKFASDFLHKTAKTIYLNCKQLIWFCVNFKKYYSDSNEIRVLNQLIC